MSSPFLKIVIFVFLVAVLYAYVGRLVPQFQGGYPPEEARIAPGMSQEDLVKIGQDLVATRGCLTCHTIGGSEQGRGPNLADIGRTASGRYKGYNSEQYLLRRLIDPDFSDVPGFPKIMPKIWMPPLSFSFAETRAVVAYLQSLGGKVTVTIEPEDVLEKPHEVRFPEGAIVTVKKIEAARALEPARIKEGRTVMAVLDPKDRCLACHKIGKEMPPGWYPEAFGRFCPDLSKIGAIQDSSYIKKKIQDPRSLPPVKGYPPGMMPAYEEKLKQKFGEKWEAKLDALADFIASNRGAQTLPPEISPWLIFAMLAVSASYKIIGGRRKG